MRGLWGLLFLLMGALPIAAHEAPSGWSYPPECCGGHDCAEISPTRVRAVQGGYLVDGKYYKALRDTRIAPDGRFHACFHPPGNLWCFFRPDEGS